MNKTRILSLIERLKVVVCELESEFKSDVGSYEFDIDEYTEILKYYDTNDDDGEEGL